MSLRKEVLSMRFSCCIQQIIISAKDSKPRVSLPPRDARDHSDWCEECLSSNVIYLILAPWACRRLELLKASSYHHRCFLRQFPTGVPSDVI